MEEAGRPGADVRAQHPGPPSEGNMRDHRHDGRFNGHDDGCCQYFNHENATS